MSKRPVVELEELRQRLSEAEETLSAIRNGEVDSLIVSGPQGDQVFSLKGAEQPYRIFVEQMREGAVTVTGDGTILYCNRRFAEMMHSRLEKVIGSQIQSFVRGSDQKELAVILAQPDDRKVRYVLSANDGSFIPAQLAFSKLPVEDEVEAICVVVTDLTEKEERQELATALQNLRSAQEQLQRQNDDLARARAEAEAASDAKDKFLAALSHELRTPLTPALITLTELLDNPSTPQAAREDLLLIRRNVDLEARLIDDLLDLTRIARGKVECKSDVTDVHSVLSAAIDICRSDIAAKNLHLHIDLQARKFHVDGDAVRLQQILWNLLRNSVKFTPEGGQIIIRSHNDGDMLKLSITDTGIGIDADAMGRIFTPFEQADRYITQKFGGLGLGLTISKRLAELHGGTITANSDGQGKGAVFTLHLPTIAAPDAPSAKPGSPTPVSRAGTLRILLVEDHVDTRRSMVRLLKRKHEVSDVGSVEAALATARGQQFDVVISDLGLPDGNGLDLMKQLREQHNLPGVCLSGFGMEDDLERSADAGFRHHLTKPVDFMKLETILNSFLSEITDR